MRYGLSHCCPDANAIYIIFTDAGGAGRYGYPNIKLDEFVWGDVDKQVMNGFESSD